MSYICEINGIVGNRSLRHNYIPIHLSGTTTTPSDIERSNTFKKITTNRLHHQKPRADHLKNIKRTKFNSTETLFLRNILMAPDTKQIIYCLARSLYQKLTANLLIPNHQIVSLPLFNELKRKIFLKFPNRFPSFHYIYKFLVKLFTARELSAECGVMAATYIDRLIVATGVTLDHTNWRPIVFIALLLADKVWEETSVWNVDYSELFKGLTVESINRLEREFLMKINFKLALSSSVYANYYFELRSLSWVSDETFPLTPLNKKMAVELEAKSMGFSNGKVNVQRTSSLDSDQIGKKRMSVGELRIINQLMGSI